VRYGIPSNYPLLMKAFGKEFPIRKSIQEVEASKAVFETRSLEALALQSFHRAVGLEQLPLHYGS
jgi:hypothetical protein